MNQLSSNDQDKTSALKGRNTILDRINNELNDTETINSTSVYIIFHVISFHFHSSLYFFSIFQYTQEIADMCSGNFVSKESNSDPNGLNVLISSLNENSTQMSQNTENELLELCTGKFVDETTEKLVKLTFVVLNNITI